MAALPSGVVVVRHGRREDADNPGWLVKAEFPFDTPLRSQEAEIRATAARLQQRGSIDVIYTSPFRRCIETAERLLRALGREGVPVFIHKGLSEVHTPHLLYRAHALTLSQTARLWLWRATYQRHSRPLRECFRPKARVLDSAWPDVPESELAASRRLSNTVMQLAARHPGKQVLFVSHGRAVQVAHEALGTTGRLLPVSYAGFVACHPRQQQRQEDQQQGREGAADGRELRWGDFELDCCWGVGPEPSLQEDANGQLSF